MALWHTFKKHDDNRQNVFPFPGASSIHLVLSSGFSGNDSKSSPESATKYDNKDICWHYIPSSNQLQLLNSYYIQPRGDDLDDLHTSPTVSKTSPEATTKYDNKNIWWHYDPSSNQLQLLDSYYIQPRGDDLDDLHTSPTVSKTSPEATTKYNDKNIKRHVISSITYKFMRWHSISRKCRCQWHWNLSPLGVM